LSPIICYGKGRRRGGMGVGGGGEKVATGVIEKLAKVL
jgi:hypothetical protein